jgi:hypothetical protein
MEKTRGLSQGFFRNNGQPFDRGTYHRARGLFGCLVISRLTIDPAAPKGQNEIAQGRAKRRPGCIAETGVENQAVSQPVQSVGRFE